jgi:hypothetical protein
MSSHRWLPALKMAEDLVAELEAHTERGKGSRPAPVTWALEAAGSAASLSIAAGDVAMCVTSMVMGRLGFGARPTASG